jgi:hypothetical protein
MPRVYPAIAVIAISIAAFLPLPACADLVLNEVLYDPEGSDEGLEFVELWNPDSIAVPLAGVLVESGDGARPGAWTSLYSGAAGDSVPPRSAFLIQGAALLAAIQNGPDALRLSRSGAVLDLLGYGALTAAELFRGAPAADAPTGQSLARVRDGTDTGSNASDWAPEPLPTPGRPNHPDVRLSIARGSALLTPEVPWPGEAALLRFSVRSSGALPIPATRWRSEISMRRGGGEAAWASASVAPGVAIAPGESTSVRCEVLVPSPGPFELRVVLAGEPGVADTVTVSMRSTAQPLVIHEIAFRDRGAGEWVELAATEDVADLGEYGISDAGGRVYAIDRGSTPRRVHAGEIFVVAQSPARLRASYALPDSVVLGCRGGWPALNDSDGDRVRVVDLSGLVSDAVPYRSEFAERGGSIERLGVALPSASPGTWSESIDPRGGTPGRPNSMEAPPPGRPGSLLLASPRVVLRSPGLLAAPAVLAFGEAARGRRVRVLVHDLLGRPRRHLVDGLRVLGDAAFVWDGRDDSGEPVPAGCYVARAETLPDGDEPMKSANVALSVVERWGR